VRIALIIERFDPMRGGRETSTAQIATAIARKGHDVTILCQEADCRPEGVWIREFGRRGIGRGVRLRNFVKDVRAAMRDEEFDVFHATLPVPGADIYQPRGGTIAGNRAARLGTTSGPRSIAVRVSYSVDSHRRVLGRLEKEVLAGPAVVLPNSEMIRREIEEHYGRTRNVRVIFNGVDVPEASDDQRAAWRRDVREQLAIDPDDVVYLSVATNFRLKGCDMAIEAFTSWHREGSPPAHLVILGPSRPQEHLRALDGDVSNRVHILPPDPEVFRWYSASDVCVLLSWYDACSRVVLEATRWGLPSITTTHNGAAEALAGGAGITVERPDDLPAVSKAMKKLADPAERRRRRNACRSIADRLSMERHVEELLAVYEETVGRRPDRD
jgi:glycosyltransferase involved in cell wall biosynthesis